MVFGAISGMALLRLTHVVGDLFIATMTPPDQFFCFRHARSHDQLLHNATPRACRKQKDWGLRAWGFYKQVTHYVG
jgi:hypothetical protein